MIRITTMPPAGDPPALKTASLDPVLNRVSQMYNDYRTGLLAHPPDWSYVPSPRTPATLTEATKLGEAASSISELLLHLAYWQPAPLG